MNPNDQKITPVTSNETNAPITSSAGQPPAYPKEDELFVIKPPEKKPLDKRSIAVVITLSVISIILLVVVLVFALIGSATGLANDYRRLAAMQINKIDGPLNELEPGAVLNGRNLEKPSKAIELSQQSQPSLESVLFVGGWSDRYTQTETLEKKIQLHYQNVKTYKNNLNKLLTFDNALNGIFDQEPNLVATVNPANSLSIRSASGSYEEFAKTIENLDTPQQVSKTQKQLAEIYHNKSSIYLAWAVLVEAGNMTGEAKAKTDLLVESGKAIALVEDQNFIELFKPTHTKLLKDQKLLKAYLAN